MSTTGNGIVVCVRVRPLNDRERAQGDRVCTHFDDETGQVALTAVDRNTLLKLQGQAARGFAFDRRYGMDDTSDTVFTDCVEPLVNSIFKGYNGTVMAYGQTGSGKTHTMSGGVGHYGVKEKGITPRVIEHVFAHVNQIGSKLKPGEDISVSASAVEIYNEELWDLSRPATSARGTAKKNSALRLQEIPAGPAGRMRAEVVGLNEMVCPTANDLLYFFEQCFNNRSTGATSMNDSSSRSHAIFTINVRRVLVTVGDEVDENLKARIRTEKIDAKLHLVDLAGSEKVKRSKVSGQGFTEATNINAGLLALGNVIVSLAEKQRHIPYRNSKLTRLVQDSLGGNSLTCLITCISPSEMDFEETSSTLKYASRACAIENKPLPNKFLVMEEDLLPVAPGTGADIKGVVSIEALLEENLKQKELRELRQREKEEKERKRQEQISMRKDELMKTPGFQRLLAQEYDRKRKQAKGGKKKGTKRADVHDLQTTDTMTSDSTDDPLKSRGDATSSESGATSSNGVLSGPSGRMARLLDKKKQKQSKEEGGAGIPPATPKPTVLEAPKLDAEHAAAPVHPELVTGSETTADEEQLTEEERRDAERVVLEQVAKEQGLEDSAADVDEDVVGEEEEEEDVGIRVLARFKVNKADFVSVFKATTKEDFKDVVKLLPENTPLPASNKMTYLIARLEVDPSSPIDERIDSAVKGTRTMCDAVGPAVGCLMATFGTNMISSCIFDFDDPEELEEYAVEERIELWGLQIPHNSLRPVIRDIPEEQLHNADDGAAEQSVAWSSVDRLNMSVGLLFALCVNAESANVRCGFCVPRQQLLRRWQGAGVRMKEVATKMRLIYPPHAHDFEYYKSSTVAYFLVDEVKLGLRNKLSLIES